MARQNQPKVVIQRGWGDQVLNILFTVFIIAIVFGIILIAVITANSTILTLQNNYNLYSYATTNSVNAINYNGVIPSTTNLLVSWSSTPTHISSSNPVTVYIFGNTITNNMISTGARNANSFFSQTTSFTSTSNSANQIVSATSGNFFNISSLTVSGLLVGDSGSTLIVNEYYQPANTVAPNPSYNTLNAISVITVSAPAIGTSGTNAGNVYATLIGYLVTLANFTGIIILLAIIVVVIGVLYYFFGGQSGVQLGQGGGL